MTKVSIRTQRILAHYVAIERMTMGNVSLFFIHLQVFARFKGEIRCPAGEVYADLGSPRLCAEVPSAIVIFRPPPPP